MTTTTANTTTTTLNLAPAGLAAWHGRARIVDVREPHEFVGELGHLPAAELVPLRTVADAAQSWDRHAPIVVICRSGARSANAARILRELGFTAVMNLDGGMMAVGAAGLAVVR
jgi:rhodanese-related sulfurtransferase